MDITSLVIILAIGAVAGFIAGNLMRGGGFGLLVNIIVGVIGSLIGGFAFNFLGISISGGIIGSIITAVIGAVILLFAISLIKKA